jgi:hypothetical protein
MIAGGGRSRRSIGALVMGLLLAVAGSQAAHAQSCQEDFQKLSEKRMGQIAVLNKLGKAAKGKMDPIAACPAARRLAAIETEMFNYIQKNKDWCNIPDQMVDNFKQQRAKTQGFATQACAFAAKAKKMQEEAAAGGGGVGPQAVRLPAGPL